MILTRSSGCSFAVFPAFLHFAGVAELADAHG